ncbi:Voltage-gated Ion Channel (VIC) Superfamily [Phytophthora cinnamomi]|uniref:Voltage-gated Ion Channel (VIC) Superfamily n=1 Tax=Phytophthora cinnamomi TaxID=4785 RepID=UPI003559535A|nr:Voltage-gated Ion Channel (VIC) Superfamily [Phytophthora cinnamomi]
MPTSRSLKLPEGIVWPPGMDAECITRLGLDGHHPIAPPGLEHLVTDEQWGDYWTWLHWYSSWQMWYMKNDKKPRRRSDKEKRSGRPHTSSDEAPVCTETITPVMEDEKFKDEPSSRHAAPPGPDELMNTTITDWGAVTLKSGSVDTFDEGRSSSAWPWRQTSPVKRRLLRLSETVASYLTRELPSQRSPEAIRAISWSARINLYLSCPEETVIGWRLNQLILLVLFVNIAIMSSETLDGPRYAGTDPDYPYMLRDSSYNSIEAFFTVIYCVEFAARWLSAPNQIQFWKGISTWVGLLAMTAAIPKLVGVAVGFNTRHADAFMYNLRILRVIRLIILSHAFVGTKVLLRAAQYSVAPLEITFFFLITVVMVFATAIFYAEPCYDLQTCTFTDIFNTGYFVMLTVATVGYGSQVPSIHNPGSLILTCIVMIFGTLYLSMPLAIIGIKYDLAWREYDEFAHNKSMEERRNRPLKEIAADVAAETKNQKLHHGNSSTPYADGAGHTLEKLERAQKQIKPESSEMIRSLMHAFPSTREKSERIVEETPPESQQEDQTRIDSQTVIDPVETFKSLPSILARTCSDSSLSSTDREEDPVSKQHYTHATEIQIINNFFLMQKVFNETIKDISLLNRLGVERINVMRKHANDAPTILAEKREREIAIEDKLAENMEFCVTACLNFAAIIDRILGTQRARNKAQRPSIIQTNALLAVAEVTGELHQAKSFKAVPRQKTMAGDEMALDSGEAPTYSPTMGVYPKHNSFKRIATLSRIFVGPILNKGDQKPPKWAEFTNKKDQRQRQESIAEE